MTFAEALVGEQAGELVAVADRLDALTQAVPDPGVAKSAAVLVLLAAGMIDEAYGHG